MIQGNPLQDLTESKLFAVRTIAKTQKLDPQRARVEVVIRNIGKARKGMRVEKKLAPTCSSISARSRVKTAG
jgi:hypothetical protein